MGVFESLGETSEKAGEKAQKYIETSKAYFTLKIFQQVSIIIGVIGKAMIIGSCLFIGFMFFAVALAIGLGKLLNSLVLGIIILGAIFFALGFIAFKFRNHIDTVVIKKMAPKFFESK